MNLMLYAMVSSRDLKEICSKTLQQNSLKTLMELSKIWKDRKDFYEASAHLTIETDRLNPAQVLEIIIKKLDVKNAIH